MGAGCAIVAIMIFVDGDGLRFNYNTLAYNTRTDQPGLPVLPGPGSTRVRLAIKFATELPLRCH